MKLTSVSIFIFALFLATFSFRVFYGLQANPKKEITSTKEIQKISYNQIKRDSKTLKKNKTKKSKQTNAKVNSKKQSPNESDEYKLKKWINTPFPRGIVKKQLNQEDGGWAVQEEVSNGTQIDLYYSMRGYLKGEIMFLPNGESFARTYFHNGEIKGLRWTKKDGARITLRFNKERQLVTRREEQKSGEQLIQKYNDRGQLISKRKDLANGQQIFTQYDLDGNEIHTSGQSINL